MTKKVHELAKEMNIQSKDLIEKANSLGIAVTNHMNVLSDADVQKILGAGAEAHHKAPSGNRPKPPMGKPVVDNAYLENKHKPPMGKPIVNTEALENREKARAAAKQEAEPVKEIKEEKPAQEKPVEKKEEKPAAKQERPAEKREERTSDRKPERRPERRNDRSDRNDRNDRSDRGDRNGERRSSDRRNDRNGERNDRRNGDHRNNDHRNSDRRNGDYRNNDHRNGDHRNNDHRNGDHRNNDHRNNDHRNGDKNVRRERPQGEGLEKMETKPSRREDNSKRKHDKEKNKLEKLERKSLEKQTRKKYKNNKPVVQEEEIEEIALPEGTVVLTVPITVAGFCEQTEVSTSKVIMTLMKLGIMANINQTIDEDTVQILAEELGISVAIGKVEEEEVEEGLELFEDEEKDLKPRSPIITVMGHVDHGKTSLLDAIRSTNVTSSESGGITQHIGASEVRIDGQKIVFLDTPGHEAFTAMRARGAHITDIAVLVVAADDSVKPQTIESISHAKAAGVPIIVAMNKMDKPTANPDKVKQDLAEQGLLVEDWGGDVICVPVSAKKGEGIVNLLEMILLQAEMMELKANPNRLAMGSVLEARLDKSKGPVATLLVTNGTLHAGQSVVVGTCSGRIRLMTDSKGKTIKKAGPATAVEILGLADVPQAGDEFNAVKEDKIAREIAEKRKEKLREEVLARNASTTLEQLFSQIQEGEVKNLNLIIKGDVQGSVGALVSSLEKLNNENVKVNCIHTGVGTVTESDVMLAGTTGSIIIGFNVRPTTAVQTMADRENIQIRTYRVIYDVIDDVENAMKGMLDPEFKEEILGKVEIRSTFRVPGVGVVGGAYVTEGKVVRNAEVRLVRDGILLHEGKISSLKRFKDDAKEVNQGYECGLGIENYNDIKEGDVIECFHMVEIER